jgi:hypothetical protein
MNKFLLVMSENPAFTGFVAGLLGNSLLGLKFQDVSLKKHLFDLSYCK